MPGNYELVQLANGAKTLFSASYGEKMHPGLGPQAEAELLYTGQLRVCERLTNHSGEFVIWDVGLGGAANAIAALRATREISGQLRIISFDDTSEPLEFALQNAAALGYFAGYENQIEELLRSRRIEFPNGRSSVAWEFHVGDFPEQMKSLSPSDGERVAVRPGEEKFPPPHAIFYDAFSPAKNPAMWTLAVFENLFRALDPQRPCALTTYSRSTMIRATMLLAGFFVGIGQATGTKEETTIAANTLDLIAEPLDLDWLRRAARSDSAEPLRKPLHCRQELSPKTLEELSRHPQFNSAPAKESR